MIETIAGLDYASKNYTSKDRILLINPPVIESRYQWVRWNQPLDLLKLSNFLKTEFGCETRLYDFMLPNSGKVSRTVNRNDSKVEIEGYTYTSWRWGKSYDDCSKWIDRMLAKWRPTEIWVTSLTSYWWKGIRETIAWIRNKLPDAKVVLYGQYPTLETEHARKYSLAHVLITEKIDLTNYFADFELYGKDKPTFCALDVRDENWSQEAIAKLESGISDFVFFNDNFLREASDRLFPQLRWLRNETTNKSSKRRPRFYALCGLYPDYFTEEAAKEMESDFVSLNFEYQVDANSKELDLDAYHRTKASYEQAGFKLTADQLTGFVNIGLPDDDLERIICHTLNLFEILGSVILKPYSPTPGTKDYEQHKSVLETERIDRLSPHFFPFSRINGVTHREYEELYTLAASLNHKVRNKAFDLFPNKLAFEMIRTSLEREVWKLGDEKSTTY